MSDVSKKPSINKFSGLIFGLGMVFLFMGTLTFVVGWWQWNPYGSNASPILLANQTFQAITAFFIAWLGYIAIVWSYKLAEGE